jgi:hypothetical protein
MATASTPASFAVFHNKDTLNGAPDKLLGPEGKQGKIYVKKSGDGRIVQKMFLQKGFDWISTVKPLLPGCPDWCPATHFGYLESGTMGLEFPDGTTQTVRAGETYYVAPGHRPIISEDTVMFEFSQDPTYEKIAEKAASQAQ